MKQPETVTARTFSPDGIHLVRTLQMMNLTLSQMADQKASILIGASFVVFSITIGQASKSDGVSVTTAVLGLSALISAMLAVWAVLPSINTKGGPGSNMLFFGNFTQVDEKLFADTIVNELVTSEQVYRLMLHDVYQNGQVLQHKKYRYIGYAYRVFLSGLMLTMLTLATEKLGFFSALPISALPN